MFSPSLTVCLHLLVVEISTWCCRLRNFFISHTTEIRLLFQGDTFYRASLPNFFYLVLGNTHIPHKIIGFLLSSMSLPLWCGKENLFLFFVRRSSISCKRPCSTFLIRYSRRRTGAKKQRAAASKRLIGYQLSN